MRLGLAGSPRALQPIDVFERVYFGMCREESRSGNVARESLRVALYSADGRGMGRVSQ